MSAAAPLEGEGFWLPPQFLADDDDDEYDFNTTQLHSEFPCHFHPLPQKFSPISTSPHGTPPNGDGDLICLNLHTGYSINSSYPPSRILPQFTNGLKIPIPSLYLNTKFENVDGRAVDQVAWPPHRTRTQGRVVSIGGGVAAEKVYAGTGVFLPRRFQHQDFRHSNASSFGPPSDPGCYGPHFEGRTSAQIHTNPYCASSFQPQFRRLDVGSWWPGGRG